MGMFGCFQTDGVFKMTEAPELLSKFASPLDKKAIRSRNINEKLEKEKKPLPPVPTLSLAGEVHTSTLRQNEPKTAPRFLPISPVETVSSSTSFPLSPVRANSLGVCLPEPPVVHLDKKVKPQTCPIVLEKNKRQDRILQNGTAKPSVVASSDSTAKRPNVDTPLPNIPVSCKADSSSVSSCSQMVRSRTFSNSTSTVSESQADNSGFCESKVCNVHLEHASSCTAKPEKHVNNLKAKAKPAPIPSVTIPEIPVKKPVPSPRVINLPPGPKNMKWTDVPIYTIVRGSSRKTLRDSVRNETRSQRRVYFADAPKIIRSNSLEALQFPAELTKKHEDESMPKKITRNRGSSVRVKRKQNNRMELQVQTETRMRKARSCENLNNLERVEDYEDDNGKSIEATFEHIIEYRTMCSIPGLNQYLYRKLSVEMLKKNLWKCFAETAPLNLNMEAVDYIEYLARFLQRPPMDIVIIHWQRLTQNGVLDRAHAVSVRSIYDVILNHEVLREKVATCVIQELFHSLRTQL